MSKETTALKEPEVSYRLPRTVVPEKYEIRLEPDLSNFTFDGEETVQIIVSEPVQEIVLNALELEISKVSVTNSKGENIQAKIKMDAHNERAHFMLDQQIPIGTHSLHIKFTGVLNDQLHGFYRSTYKDANGNKKVIATTQMESTHARRAFPCWDEPDFKATFKVTLIVDEALTAISNAQIKSTKPVDERGKKEVHFNETMKMSSYLVAFIIGEFEHTAERMVDGTPVRIFCPPGKLPLAEFGLEIAEHSLTFFNNYYGIKYPGDKLDLIAIPDFAFGAMENLGAVTFRETALLVDKKNASHSELERVADVVAHEIAHMWFGDLATMKWWNGIWLNEAFATFMEMLAVDSFKPEWKRWESFGVSRSAAYDTDGLKSTRTIEFPVHHPSEADGMFDVLTYQKGASVLRMLEQFLGKEQFRRGIMLYLAKHKYSNTETTDLWDAIEESCKQPVRQMMDSWIYQEGHPLITVEKGKSDSEIVLKQQRFLFLPEGSPSKTLFHVPLMIKAKIGKEIVHHKVLLSEESTTLQLEGKPEFIVVNEGGHGFYRVRYAPEFLNAIKTHLKELDAIERFNLANDTWAAVLAGVQPLSEYLQLAALFTEETDKNVWTVLLGSISYMNRLIGPEKSVPAQVSKFVTKLASGAHKKLGWEPKDGEDDLTHQLRGMLISSLGCLGADAEVKNKAIELYDKYKAERSSVSPDVAPALISILAYNGDETRYNEFAKAYKDAATPQDEDRYMYSLTAFRSTALLTKTLEKTINGEIRTQNSPFVVRSVMLNTAGRDLAWKFVKDNWETFNKQMPENILIRMCEGIIGLVSDEQLKDATDFFTKHELKQGKKIIAQYLEKLTVSVNMQKRESATLKTL